MRALAIATLLLSGCHDFVGDEGNIGFSSDLRLAASAWTPAHRVASGTAATFAAIERVDSDQELAVQARVRGLEAWDDGPGQITVTDGHRSSGVVRWTGDASDHFRVRFAPAQTASLLDEAELALGQPQALPQVALVQGTSWRFAVRVEDRRGRELGFRDEDLGVRGEDGVSGWISGDGVRVAADGSGELVLSLLGQDLSSTTVLAVPASAIDEAWLSAERLALADSESTVIVRLHAQLADGTPVYGAPVNWTWDSTGMEAGAVPDDRPDVLLFDGLDEAGQVQAGQVQAEVAGLSLQITLPEAITPP